MRNEGTEGLPAVKAPRMRELVWFDLTTGLPTSLKILRAELSKRQLASVLLHYLKHSLRRDPLRNVKLKGWPPLQERLARHQFRAAMILDDILTQDLKLPQEEVKKVAGKVIAAVGARFIAANVPIPEVSDWRAVSNTERGTFLQELTKRFFNAKIENITVSEEKFGFDVTGCQFVLLAHEIGRPTLIPFFCDADSLFFKSGETPVEFARSETLARGGTHCDFRFELSRQEEQEK